ncbi:hypothetical protein EMM73_08875 [Rheinheimera sediminis]|nr:hypothetical protein EMM73_08875 [Rheinheimera sp. YQF-1]
MTMSKAPPDEPEGQRLAGLSAALKPAYVELLHRAVFALHKNRPDCCKNNPEASTRSKHQIPNTMA